MGSTTSIKPVMNDANKGKSPVAKPDKPVKKAADRAKLPPTVMHPLLNPGPDGKATTKLKEWPADYKTTAHKPLAASNFEDPAVFFNGKADRLQKVVDKLREEAKNAGQLAGIQDKDKANAKKFLKLKTQLEAIQSELSSGGVDVEAMLKLLRRRPRPRPAPLPKRSRAHRSKPHLTSAVHGYSTVLTRPLRTWSITMRETIMALKRYGWTYDWSADRLLGHGSGWAHPTLGFACTLATAVVLTARVLR